MFFGGFYKGFSGNNGTLEIIGMAGVFQTENSLFHSCFIQRYYSDVLTIVKILLIQKPHKTATCDGSIRSKPQQKTRYQLSFLNSS